MIKKTCKQCAVEFTVDDKDLEFLKKISPTFAGTSFQIPPPDYCPTCKHMRRLAWRNEIHLYSRKCDLCEKQIVSMYSPNKPFKVYCLKCWWSDKWDGKDYGMDYDPNKPFPEQFKELLLKIPHAGMTVTNSTNCDYCTNTVSSKNCYMLLSARAEDSMYGRKLVDCREVFDSLFVTDSEKCYEIIFSANCYNSKFIFHGNRCSDSMFLFDAEDCDNCFMSSNIRHKKYFYRNRQLTKNAYEKAVKIEYDGSYQKQEKLRREYLKLIKGSVHKENRNLSCENCTGNYLNHCKNCVECFETIGAENSKRVYDSMGDPSSDQLDCDLIPGGELNYDSTSSYPLYHSAFCVLDYGCHNSYYSFSCQNNCDNLFGCASLKRDEYCVLNKQYSKQEYEKLVLQILNNMKVPGEWGNFIPPDLATFGYNESIANDFWPMSRAEAKKLGYSWEDNDCSLQYSGVFYQPKDNTADYANDEQERKKLLSGVLKCQVSNRPFKILSQELVFYIKNNIPIPRISFFERHRERMRLRNPRQLFDRKCDKCKREMKTTYSLDRPEKVYCEECYRKAII